jgi:hypothetical protein
MVKLPYTLADSVPLKAPRGKLPFIVDNGKKVADSQLGKF